MEFFFIDFFSGLGLVYFIFLLGEVENLVGVGLEWFGCVWFGWVSGVIKVGG